MTRRVLASAPEVHFSYARQSEGVEARPSRLVVQVAGLAPAVNLPISPLPTFPSRSPLRSTMQRNFPTLFARSPAEPPSSPRNRNARSRHSQRRASTRRSGTQPKPDSPLRSAAFCCMKCCTPSGPALPTASAPTRSLWLSPILPRLSKATCAACSTTKCLPVRASACRQGTSSSKRRASPFSLPNGSVTNPRAYRLPWLGPKSMRGLRLPISRSRYASTVSIA